MFPWLTLELEELDLDGEWDPEKHDAQMASLYADEVVEPDEVTILCIVPSDFRLTVFEMT